MSNKYHRVTVVSVPPESRIAQAYPTTDLADAYSAELPPEASNNPELLARFIFGLPSPVTDFLLKIRDALVVGFGLKTAKDMSSSTKEVAGRIGIFRIYNISETEIVLGEDDKHLDFRVSLLCSEQQAVRRVTLSTVVHCHNRLGRCYIFVIAPFHRRIVRSSLRRAARTGWPAATEA